MAEDIDVVNLVAAVLPILLKNDPVPNRNSALTGKMYYAELMASQSEPRYLSSVRMRRPLFIAMRDLLINSGGLTGTDRICEGQKLMIYIHALTANSESEIAERWQHSTSTISVILHEIAKCFMRVKDMLIIPPQLNDPTHPHITNNPKFFPYFDNCMGALDGSHIPASVAAEDQATFRNRKNFISQNVLSVVDFSGLFTYVLAGWEGSAGDGRVYAEALSNGLRTFVGKYYLGDAGYALSRNCLTPYRGIRYHLKEWQRGNARPRTKEELFNLRHSSLRNIIERSFGVLKKRFPILENMHSFEFSFQVELVMSCFMIGNFIKLNNDYDDIFDLTYVDMYDPDPAQRQQEENYTTAEIRNLNAWRNGIAQAMWDDYVAHGQHAE